jgi:hypothetical protein
MVLLFGTIVAVVVLYAAGRDCYVEAGLDRPGPSDGGARSTTTGPVADRTCRIRRQKGHPNMQRTEGLKRYRG